MKGPSPSRSDLIDYLTDNRSRGAIQKALCLTIMAGVRRDLIDHNISLGYPAATTTEVTEMRHIYPKAWCRKSRSGDLAQF